VDLKELADLKPSGILEASADPRMLGFALQKILGTREQFAYHDVVHGGLGSIRIFFANLKEGERALSAHDGHPTTIATNLMESINCNAVRHSEQPPGKRTKGWNIRSVEIDGRHAAIAEAAWI
jgi:hypothetical protein